MTLDLLIMVYLWTKRIKFLFLMFGINGPPYMQQWVRQIKTKIIVEYEPRYKRVVAFVSVAIEVWQKQADKRKTHIKVKWERGTNTSVSQEGSQSKAEFRGDRNIFEFIIFFCIQVHVACFNGRISYRLASLSWPHPQSNILPVISFKIKMERQRHK